jgi:hypothetical protein
MAEYTFPPFPGFIRRNDRDGPLCSVFVAGADGVTFRASVYMDDVQQPPDRRQDGFWPSLNPADDGYIGDGKTRTDLSAAKAQARRVLEAFEEGTLFYVGVDVVALREGVIPSEFKFSSWGLECNWPGCDNSYLNTTAQELLDDLQRAARQVAA